MGIFKKCADSVRNTVDQAKAVHEKCGRPTALILCDMAGCFVKRGVWPDQYRDMGFESLNAKQRSGHLNNRIERKIEKKLCPHDKFGVLFRNKYCFYRMYSDFFDRQCFRSDTLTAEQLDILFEREGRFIYKPMEGKGGSGVMVFDKEELMAGGVQAALDKLHGMELGILEQMIPQHPALSELYPAAVNPIRVVTVYKDGECRRIYGTLTLGRGKQFANASSDAMSALVDMDTGVLTTTAVDHKHNEFATHPVTGKPINVIEADTDRNNYMTAAEAMEYGLVDKVLGKRE